MDPVEYLDHVASRPCVYGQLDCATFMADWLVTCGWPDPMADRRGTYATKREYRIAIRNEGGIVASCERRFVNIGLVETASSGAGDVALVMAPFALFRGKPISRPTGAICINSTLRAVLDWPRGVVGAPLPIVKAWSVNRA